MKIEKCPKCGSKEVTKSGQTQAKEPKQKWYCKGHNGFFSTPLGK